MWELSENDSVLPRKFSETLYLQLNWIFAFVPFFYIIILLIASGRAGFVHAAVLFLVLAEWMALRLFFYLHSAGILSSTGIFGSADFFVRIIAGLPATILMLQSAAFSVLGILRFFSGIFFVQQFRGLADSFFYVILSVSGIVFYQWFVAGFRLLHVNAFQVLYVSAAGSLFLLLLWFAHSGKPAK